MCTATFSKTGDTQRITTDLRMKTRSPDSLETWCTVMYSLSLEIVGGGKKRVSEKCQRIQANYFRIRHFCFVKSDHSIFL